MRQELMDDFTQRDMEAEMCRALSLLAKSESTQEDVNIMFQFLYRQIDPSHRFDNSLDVEIPAAFSQSLPLDDAAGADDGTRFDKRI